MPGIAEHFPGINHLSTECDKEAVHVYVNGEFDSVYIYISCNTSENEVGEKQGAVVGMFIVVTKFS